jgi:hypothetical protein
LSKSQQRKVKQYLKDDKKVTKRWQKTTKSDKKVIFL